MLTLSTSHNLALECPVLLQPSMGIVSVTSRTVGSVAMYSCNEGYQLNGSREIVCGEDESWSDEPPLCSCKTSVIIVKTIRTVFWVVTTFQLPLYTKHLGGDQVPHA